MFICIFELILYVTVKNIFQLRINVSCSRTQRKDASEAQTPAPWSQDVRKDVNYIPLGLNAWGITSIVSRGNRCIKGGG